MQAKAEAAEKAVHRESEHITKAQNERDNAREEAAKLRGQVEALQTQATDQLRALSSR